MQLFAIAFANRASDPTPLRHERESQCACGGGASVDIANAVGERSALLRCGLKSGAQQHVHVSLLDRLLDDRRAL